MSSKTLEGKGSIHESDQNALKRLDSLFEKSNRPFSECVDTFPAYIRRYRLTRFLQYYELFRMTQSLPGDIVEAGVFRGFSFFALAHFTEIFCMGDKTKKVFGFENFKGFEKITPEDGAEEVDRQRVVGGYSPADFREEFMELMDIHRGESFAPWVPRAELIEGDVMQTIPEFVEQNPGLRISMLHIDIDVYEPTKCILEHCYPRLVPGGVLVLDDYGNRDWGGETAAVDEYFNSIGIQPAMKTFSWGGNPNCYIIKE